MNIIKACLVVLSASLAMGCASIDYQRGFSDGVLNEQAKEQKIKSTFNELAQAIVVSKDGKICLLGLDGNVYCPPVVVQRSVKALDGKK